MERNQTIHPHFGGDVAQVLRRLSRRRFLVGAGTVAAIAAAQRLFDRGVFAEALQKPLRTPGLTEGPFYPDHLP
ncbi:MAG: hypothetical protein ACREJC_07310, partial [Tepidisphaeraceae bacterium]